MEEVINFYDSIYQNGRNRDVIHEEIRDFARRTVDMSVVMKPIMEYIQKEK